MLCTVRSADHEGHDCTDESFDQCMTSKLEDLMMESHGCAVPFLKSTKPVCTDLGAIQDTFWIAYNRVTNQARRLLRKDFFKKKTVLAKSMQVFNVWK